MSACSTGAQRKEHEVSCQMTTKNPPRKKINPAIETAVLAKSVRRCTLCYQVDGDLLEKLGQIAHLDRNPANGEEDNLAWMCLDHHSLYDSSTKQHKNYTIREVKAARVRLYSLTSSGDHLTQKILHSLAGEWKGTFRTIKGRSKGKSAEYTLWIVENMHRSYSGILLYEARDSRTHTRISAGADLLLPDLESRRQIIGGTWRPQFKRCVHWQPPEDSRPSRVKRIDEYGEHIYQWEVKLELGPYARMNVKIRAQRTEHESEGILEKHV